MRSTILITGASGQVGTELRRLTWPTSVEVVAADSSALDITDQISVQSMIDAHRPSVIINAAAYTAVDKAEEEEERALQVNATAVGFIADAANKNNAMLIHMSTDYVFDGEKAGWYKETDATNPLSAYGRTKLAGEEAALQANKSLTLRTSWVYSATGGNFVKTIRRLIAERPELNIIDDQEGCPTAAADIAAAVAAVVRASDFGHTPPPSRSYHLAAPDETTWHGFALAVMAGSADLSSIPCHPIPTSAYPVAAVRPKNSKLDTTLIGAELDIKLPSWRESLGQVLGELDGGS